VLSDFVYYWVHRLEHRSRFFWAHHGVHHSSSSFDLSTAGRIAWTEPLVSWYGLVPLVLVGFHPLQVLVLSTLGLLYQTWIHTQKIGDLGAFELVFNSPAAHRVHHASNAPYLDKNYGAVLIVWDRLFGTYARATPDEPIRYGLTTDIGTKNPVRINLHGYAELLRGLRSSETWRDRLLWVLGPPEWSTTHGFAATRPTSLWRTRATSPEAEGAARQPR
jgi:sterol desaturase/sphingolipid hydroxylase (fatty acid hydroxylase superfamily)